MRNDTKAINGSASDAEGAMRALGPQLEWEEDKTSQDPSTQGFVAESARHSTKEGVQIYAAFIPEGHPQAIASVLFLRHDGVLDEERTYPQGVPLERFYQTLAQAKAACERHAATGDFPASEPGDN